MKNGTILSLSTATALCLSLVTSCASKAADYATEKLTTVRNPYLPLWEHTRDGEPDVVVDPDNPGTQRAYTCG